MTERSRAYSFVDRITDLDSGKSARGRFRIPAALPNFPACLVAEAIGQLAAWVAMERSNFERRPVAGIAGEVTVDTDPAPGMELELTTDISRWSHDGVSYSGAATVAGEPLLELRRCVGPLLPMEEFDDPAAVREEFLRLRGAGLPERDLSAAIRQRAYLTVRDREPGKWLRGDYQIPPSAPFFQDHFPRRAVFPGTLLLDALMRIGIELAAEAIDATGPTLLRVSRVKHVRLRSFIPPGQLVEMAAELVSATDSAVTVSLGACIGDTRAADARADIVVWHPE